MSLRIVCPCGTKLRIESDPTGHALQCPRCNQPLNLDQARPESGSAALWLLAGAVVGIFVFGGPLLALLIASGGDLRMEPPGTGGKLFVAAKPKPTTSEPKSDRPVEVVSPPNKQPPIPLEVPQFRTWKGHEAAI